ncbi:MAG: anthranilate synthase component I [Calditrichota bacterium]
MTYSEFQKLASPGRIIPVYRRLNADFLTPIMAYIKLRSKEHYSFLLESVIKGQHLGRYSFIGNTPLDVNQFYLSTTDHSDNEDFFRQLQSQLHQYQSVIITDLPRFTGGAVGFIGYDMIRQIEEIPYPENDHIQIPDAVMAFYHDLIAFDHLKNQVILIVNTIVEEETNPRFLFEQANQRLDQLTEKLNSPFQPDIQFAADLNKLQGNFSEEAFKNIVFKAKEHIFAGDIFQVVLSQRMEVPFTGDSFQVYRALRNINPSPYLFFLDFLDYQLIGSSPEPLIRVENREAEIIPIAGTRPRGNSPEEDQALSESLLKDPKELAEHIMLVDLARNDMARVSEYGSVKVNDFRTIESYSHVMHIISRVNGKLKPPYDTVDAFKAAFPAGTVSGAPKIRAMEIINDLEKQKRGYYAGAIGYFDYSGNMDMCIAIRTLLAKNNKIYFQAGAGIVADSDPATEYQETINKGNALKSAIEQAAGGINGFIHR